MLTDRKLANIVLEMSNRCQEHPELYYRSENGISAGSQEGSIVLQPGSEYDFSTYFNAFSRCKWEEYADIDNVHLHLEVKGSADIELLGVKREGKKEPEQLSLCSSHFESDEAAIVEIEFPKSDAPLLAFRLKTISEVEFYAGWYYTKIEEKRVRDVHLALATTTFKKEEYITANVELFKKEISQDPLLSGHVSFVVVDNGRTLDPSELQGDGVFVFANANVGGSGGFARGMIEAKRLEAPVTHVLIMDDDIALSAESVKRTFMLLSVVNDEYAEAFVSGAMLSLLNQTFQFEDVGWADETGKFGRIKSRMYMDKMKNVVRNEILELNKPNMYAAFWYCCIPMTVIRREGLPLPLFIRYDDAEYGMRCKARFMTMNGINVWHMDFAGRYNAFYERYCATRNALIIQATSGVCANVDFMNVKILPHFMREMKKFNYGSAELLLDGIEDYLAGPGFIATQQCERLLKEKMQKVEKMVPLAELGLEGRVDPDELEAAANDPGFDGVMAAIDRATFNGQRLVPGFMKKDETAIVRFSQTGYPARALHFCKKNIQVNSECDMGFASTYDENRFKALYERYLGLMERYAKEHEAVNQSYAEAKEWLVSDEFWKQYLEIE